MKKFFTADKVPRAFFWRRMHSLTGFWLAIFLIEHLLTNSQAALMVGDDGSGFIKAVNWIKDLPFLPVIEIGLLGIPILIHMFWGIAYLRESSVSSLPYSRNKAYNWQRITSWILLLGLIAHIVHMRFVEYPDKTTEGYAVEVTQDAGLTSVAKRLHITLVEREGKTIALVPDFGTAELMVVRETFKMPLMIALYTIFVVAATYHAYNGLWTFCITWGITLTRTSQQIMMRVSVGLIVLISFLGLSAIFGTYWINLRY